MMAENKKVPGLRFKGFTDAWEQHKLGDYIKDSGDRTSDFEKYPLYSLTIENGVTPKTQRYERGFLVTKEDDLFKIVIPGNFVTNPMNLRFGAVGYNRESFSVSVSGYYDVFELDANQCGHFWNTLFKTPAGLQRFDDAATGSLIEKRRVHYSELKKVEFAVPPSIGERKTVSAFMERIDGIIDLYRRKHEKLLILKKSMLEKMFPKAGSNVPEIRFAGFTDAWEWRRFDKIANRASMISAVSGFPRVEYEDIISGTGRLNKDVFAKGSMKAGIEFHVGDVLYGKLRPYLQNWFLPSFSGLAVGDFWVLQPQNVDSSFLYRLVQSQQFDEVANQSTGTKMPRADWKLISISEFAVPLCIEEQTRIGRYFNDLDNLITLYQRKYEKLRQLKRSLLQKMFV